MRPPAIEVEIDELITGLALGPVDARRLAAGLEIELQRLLVERAPSKPVAIERATAGHLAVRQGARPADVGAAIARSVHGVISGVNSPTRLQGPVR